MQKELEIDHLWLTIGKKTLLNEFELSVPKNKITAVTGPSGSGKSLLLKSIIGILREEVDPKIPLIYRGKILFQGVNLLELHDRELEVIRRKIAYVSQNPIAFPMNIFDNIAFALKYWNPRISNADLEQKIYKVLKTVRLWDEVKERLNESPNDLSAGQLQRLTLARSLVLSPDLLLLDEPCAHIDPISTSSLEDVLIELKQDSTILLVTHNLQQAARISDNTVFITYGKIIEASETDEVFKRPKEKSTEDYFLGRYG